MTREEYISEWEEEHQRDLERIRNFRLIDDDFMKAVFTVKECVQCTLRIIMDKPDLVVKSVVTEYEVYNLYGRSVRLDAFAEDGSGREYDVEIQRADRGASPKRARFNSSLMDSNALKKGNDFDALPESYVIFITESDVMGNGLPIYHIDRVVRETGEVFDDKSHIIYVNNEIKDNTPLGMLMQDFAQTRADRMHYKDLADTVRYFKETEEGVGSMCKAMEEMRDIAQAKGEAKGRAEGRAEGRAQGRAQGRAEGIAKLLEQLQKLGVNEDMLLKAREAAEESAGSGRHV